MRARKGIAWQLYLIFSSPFGPFKLFFVEKPYYQSFKWDFKLLVSPDNYFNIPNSSWNIPWFLLYRFFQIVPKEVPRRLSLSHCLSWPICRISALYFVNTMICGSCSVVRGFRFPSTRIHKLPVGSAYVSIIDLTIAWGVPWRRFRHDSLVLSLIVTSCNSH